MEEELNKLTVVKLKDRLGALGLDKSGVKQVLVKRLAEALSAQQQQRDDTAAEHVHDERDEEDTNDSEYRAIPLDHLCKYWIEFALIICLLYL